MDIPNLRYLRPVAEGSASELTPQKEQLLRDQVITDDQPGTILADFEVLLDFVGTDGVRTPGKHHLLPMKSLGELDGRLRRPLDLPLKRPQQRSYPNLQGLYLLLRATGLGEIRGRGSKVALALNPDVLASWRGLSATERYFTLLEAWLLRARPEMIGERGGGLFDGFLMNCLQLMQFLPVRGLRVKPQGKERVYLHGIGNDYEHLLLLDMFGLLAVTPGRPSSTRAWLPARVDHVPFGDALFLLLCEAPSTWGSDQTEQITPTFGQWMGLLQPYFPQWRNNLIVPQAERREGSFIFKVSLGSVWRRIAIPDDATVEDLADLILYSVDFDYDHLYRFTCKDRFGSPIHVDHPHEPVGFDASQVEVGELPLRLGGTMTFWYDFSDDWRFKVKLEAVQPRDPAYRDGAILEAKGDAPSQYGWGEEEEEEEEEEERDEEDDD